MIINRIYETQKPSVAVACFLPGRAKDLSARLHLDLKLSSSVNLCFYFWYRLPVVLVNQR